MTRRHILFAVMALLLVTAIVILEWPPSEPKLDVVLRCEEGISGTLSVTTILPDSDEQQVEESFDVAAACLKREFSFTRYTDWADVLFVFKRNSSKITRLISEYGPNIQVDNHDGFYVVIAISNAHPFLTNDSI